VEVPWWIGATLEGLSKSDAVLDRRKTRRISQRRATAAEQLHTALYASLGLERS
jgi:hypothetical protein